jgi:hypothetical protein
VRTTPHAVRCNLMLYFLCKSIHKQIWLVVSLFSVIPITFIPSATTFPSLTACVLTGALFMGPCSCKEIQLPSKCFLLTFSFLMSVQTAAPGPTHSL